MLRVFIFRQAIADRRRGKAAGSPLLPLKIGRYPAQIMEIATWCTLGLKMPSAMFRPESLILSPFDTQGPTGLSLSGPAKTNQNSVTLTISVTDSSDVAGLYFSTSNSRPTGWAKRLGHLYCL